MSNKPNPEPDFALWPDGRITTKREIKYVFTVVMDRELSHDEMNELEMALCAQAEDYGYSNAQLVRVFPKQ